MKWNEKEIIKELCIIMAYKEFNYFFFPLKDERPKKKERKIEWIIFIQALLCIRILTYPIKLK